jgi:uncharacterized protein YxeA
LSLNTLITLLFLFQSENIQIFPITVASTFVTLSWNTSSNTVSTGHGYFLQVKRKTSDVTPIKQYKDIDVGLKMNSYTINGLEPDHTYIFELCLRKDKYVMVVSSTKLTTKNKKFQSDLGIETDYVSMFAVTIIITGFLSTCVCISVLRLIRNFNGDNYNKGGDSISQREMITSPSDHSSVVTNTQRPNGQSSSYRLSNVATGDNSRLVENEVTSPVEEVVFPPRRSSSSIMSKKAVQETTMA